ncbi:MAG: ROK family protein [Candidatus Actinomarina sp.]|nr:ROK family protein [Actinomycetota bacterium]MBL6837357.1 ROK family protein [Candidatus Actinomarina sp.]
MKIGVDWGGTKIEAVAIDPLDGSKIKRTRIDAPQNDYEKIILSVVNLVNQISEPFKNFTVGVGMPGSLHPQTGLVQVSNTEILENKPVKADLEQALGYEIKIANDADCLALSEAVDGAGKNQKQVFAVILGTGVGAGYVVNKELIEGPNKLTGEWGQNPIPGPMDEYERSIKRHCGRVGAIEMFISGPGLEQHYDFLSGKKITSKEIVKLYREQDETASLVMDNYFERVARSFSSFVNILDPEIIVCGGGMSDIDELYDEIPKRIIPYLASDFFLTPIVKAIHGNSSGVRGAAFLWD